MKTADITRVVWREDFSIGIEAIDIQHRALLQMTSDLFTACLYGRKIVSAYLQATACRTVNYIRRHFASEEKLMEKMNYPHLAEHRKQHQDFIRELLRLVKKFTRGRENIPPKLARFSRDWMSAHIAIMVKSTPAIMPNPGVSRNTPLVFPGLMNLCRAGSYQRSGRILTKTFEWIYLY